MKQFIVDAFSERIFHGNQAAICVMDAWLTDELMINIARENNFSETAFTVKTNDGYEIRWFTPGGEVKLCGHATLATSYVLFHYYETDKNNLVFHSLSGDLLIGKDGDYIAMDFPMLRCREIEITSLMAEAFGTVPLKAYIDDRLLLVYENEQIIRNMKPDFEKVALLHEHGVAVTSAGSNYDCVSRFFAPRLKVNEDPVTGSAHCMIAPYWGERLGKKIIRAYQASERGGELLCELRDDRVVIKGKAALYSIGELCL
ncbi:PhzF family phenazine biosynthesis protein [Brachyspira sp.]|uniref:PhzF family phenazine biosynthesis protein n=1 Tax=Brachyspira sp. TaxID=1977261 RepID=UPI003D7F16A6